MKKPIVGILAHVDAGKTTLSEDILLHTGVIRSAGRVDRGDTHLDTDEMERDAVLELQDGSRKPVSLSVRSELGPNFRNICGFAGTLDIDAVIGITAGGVHYDFE